MRRHFPPGFSIGGSLLGGLILPQLLAVESQAGVQRSHKALIHVYLPGRPPHLDMWDLQPQAPAEIRGEFKPIKPRVERIEICKHFPRIAAMLDKFAIVRNWEGRGGHDANELASGHGIRSGEMRPAFGSVVSRCALSQTLSVRAR